jgi:hypothetical protein
MKCLKVLLLMVTVSGLSACSNPPEVDYAPGYCECAVPAPTSSPQAVWTSLAVNDTCEGGQNGDCPGAYGFTINPNGSFQAGPNDLGVIVGGRVTSMELAMINSDLAVFNPGFTATLALGELSVGPTCVDDPTLAGVMSNVTVGFSDGIALAPISSNGSPGQFCFTADPIGGERLREDVNALLEEYYPNPFPTQNPVPSPAPGPSASPSPQS